MPCSRTSQEIEFLEYFRRIDKHAIKEILSQYRSTGPVGYATSLVLARILKVKERISSDRELSDKLMSKKVFHISSTRCIIKMVSFVPGLSYSE